MRSEWKWGLAIVAALALAAPADGIAQGRRDHKSKVRDIDRRDLDVLVLLDQRGRRIVLGDEFVLRRERPRRGHGPPFCRSGVGHPVHGPAWCLEKGWGLGARNRVFLDRGRVVFWDDDEAFWVRNVRFDQGWTLWYGLANGLLALVDD